MCRAWPAKGLRGRWHAAALPSGHLCCPPNEPQRTTLTLRPRKGDTQTSVTEGTLLWGDAEIGWKIPWRGVRGSHSSGGRRVIHPRAPDAPAGCRSLELAGVALAGVRGLRPRCRPDIPGRQARAPGDQSDHSPGRTRKGGGNGAPSARHKVTATPGLSSETPSGRASRETWMECGMSTARLLCKNR